MRKNISGFTLVELLIVCVIIVMLATISTVSYLGYQRQAAGSRATAMGTLVANGAEKYYQKNGEYPTSLSTTNGGPMSTLQLNNAATAFGTPADSLKNDSLQLVYCTTTTCGGSYNKNYLYYAARTAADSSDKIYANIGGSSCSILLSGTGNAAGNSSFFITYFDPYNNSWIFMRSSQGIALIDGTGCSFR